MVTMLGTALKEGCEMALARQLMVLKITDPIRRLT